MSNRYQTKSCFNPLPSPKQGETRRLARIQPYAHVSIRSPHRSKGRPQQHVHDPVLDDVSIRSPHRSKGRPLALDGPSITERFQSAPLTEARGDAPLSVTSRPLSRFQSAPLTEARGDSFSSEPSISRCCFNPLPSPKQGETESSCRIACRVLVSIRSPHRSKGRPAPALDMAGVPRVSIRSPHRSKGRPHQPAACAS